MKIHNLKILLGLPLLMLIACDNISEENRYIETGPVEVARKVLLEEFTGQRCVNCPDAHRIIESLEEQYGSDLIVVSIHAGNFGIKYPTGLKQTVGDEYASHWNVEAYPSGVIDRTGSAMNMDLWATAIREEISKTTDLTLSLEAQISDNEEKIDVFTTLISPQQHNGSLQLWIVENNIVALQLDGNETRLDYIHNNVFRVAANGVWGEEIPLDSNEVKYVSNSIEIDSKWNLQNIDIVGFYYDANGVIQVERIPLTISK